MKKVCLITLMLVLFTSIVFASTQTFPDITVTNATGTIVAGNHTNSSLFDLGESWSYTLEKVSYVDASTNANKSAGGCNETLSLWYGTTNTSLTTVSLTGADTATAVSTDLSDVSSRYVKFGGYFGYNTSISNCSITTATLTYQGSFEDVLEGLPQIGSDVGSFLTNLAPGVGAFIIILAVFGGVGAMVYAIAGLVRKRIGEK